MLVNDIWGGDPLTEFGKGFWNCKLENGLMMLDQAVHTHIITAHYAVPLMLGRRRAIIFEITDGDNYAYRGNLFYDLVKTSVIRLAFGMAKELRRKGIVAVALTPGFLRSEAVLEHYWVTEANWKSAGEEPPGRKKQVVHDDRADFRNSELRGSWDACWRRWRRIRRRRRRRGACSVPGRWRGSTESAMSTARGRIGARTR